MISNRRKHLLFSVLFLVFLFPLNATAKLPPVDFATARLLKSRLPASYEVEITLLEKTITKYRGTAELFAGSFDVGALKITKKSASTAIKLFSIAFGSQNVVEDVEASFSKLDKTRSVGVHRDALTHRYGSTTRVSVFRDSGALAKIQTTVKGKAWTLEVSDLEKSTFGTIYRDGLVVMRFTIRKE